MVTSRHSPDSTDKGESNMLNEIFEEVRDVIAANTMTKDEFEVYVMQAGFRDYAHAVLTGLREGMTLDEAFAEFREVSGVVVSDDPEEIEAAAALLRVADLSAERFRKMVENARELIALVDR
jgi:hypothetical protein